MLDREASRRAAPGALLFINKFLRNISGLPSTRVFKVRSPCPGGDRWDERYFWHWRYLAWTCCCTSFFNGRTAIEDAEFRNTLPHIEQRVMPPSSWKRAEPVVDGRNDHLRRLEHSFSWDGFPSVVTLYFEPCQLQCWRTFLTSPCAPTQSPIQSSSVGRTFKTSLARGLLATGSSFRIFPSRNTSTRLENCAMSCSWVTRTIVSPLSFRF